MLSPTTIRLRSGRIIYCTHAIEKTASQSFGRRSLWLSRCDNWFHQGVEKNEGEAAQSNEKEIGVKPHLFNLKSNREGVSSFRSGSIVRAGGYDGHGGLSCVLINLLQKDRSTRIVRWIKTFYEGYIWIFFFALQVIARVHCFLCFLPIYQRRIVLVGRTNLGFLYMIFNTILLYSPKPFFSPRLLLTTLFVALHAPRVIKIRFLQLGSRHSYLWIPNCCQLSIRCLTEHIHD